jgi:hypothetical protein
VQFDVALNLIWFVLGAFALTSTYRSSFSRYRTARTSGWLHICGVALIVAALFPYISATDDVLRIRHMDAQQHTRQVDAEKAGHRQHEPEKRSSSDTLIRLYETMDTSVVASVRDVPFVLFFVALVVVALWSLFSRETPLRSGRAPPRLTA